MNNQDMLPTSPPPPPLQSESLSTESRMLQLESKLDSVLDAFTRLTNHLSTTSPSSTNHLSNTIQHSSISSSTPHQIHHSSIGIKRELTPHPTSTTQSTDSYSSSSSSVPFSPSSQHHVSSSSSRPYNGLVKFNPPPYYTGKPDGDQQLSLSTFISSMNRYLSAVHIDPYSDESLQVAVMRLSDFASQWYDNIINRDPHLIINWFTLQEQLKLRFQPKAQEQIAFANLLKVRYTNSIEKLNYEFLKHLQLLPSYNNVQSETVMIGIYMNALTEASGTTYICTTLRNAIARKEVQTLSDVQSLAILAESNLGHRSNVRSSKVPYVPPHRSSTSLSSSHRYTNYNNNHNHHRTNTNFQRSSIPAPSFSTPAKLNNVQADDNQSDDDENNNNNNHNDQTNHAALDYENELECATTPSFHDEQLSNESNNNETDIAFLNAVNFYENAKRHQPTLTPHEIDRRRRNGTCFKCNNTGHFANKCPTSSSSSTISSKKF